MNQASQPVAPRVEPTEAFLRQVKQPGPRMGYNMTIGQSPQFIWFRNAKVATRTTLNVLDQAGVIYQTRHEFGLSYNPEDPDNYFKFAFVRNPWDRLVSAWLNKIIKPAERGPKWYFTIEKDLEDLVDFLDRKDFNNSDPHFWPQVRNVPTERLDFLGHHESFEADLDRVVAQLGFERTEAFEKKNSTHGRRHYREYYTPALRDRVAKLYREDIEKFSYEF